MSKKTQGSETEKPTFDPADFLGDDEIEGADESADFGDDFDPEADDREDDADVIDTEDEEPEDDAGDESEDDAEDESEDDAEADTDEESEAETEEEPEAEAEAESESESEDEPQDDKTRGKPNHMIPKRRLDSEIAKRRQLEQRLKDLEKTAADARKEAAEKAKVPDDQINGWLKEASDKALEGDSEAAAKLHKQALDAMAQNRGEPTEGQQQQLDPEDLVSQIEERVELKHTVKEVFQDYPVLDPNNESFDESLNEEVVEFQDFYMSKGYTPATAVEKAVAALAATHGLASARAEAPAPKKPVRDTSPKVEQKLKAAKKQPPEPATRKGNKATAEETVDLSQLDDEGFLALPESVRSRLRGD